MTPVSNDIVTELNSKFVEDMRRTRIESIVKCPHSAIDHLKALVNRLESGSIKTGDRLQDDDFDMVQCFGYPSQIVNDGAQLLRLLNDKLVYLTNND